MKKRNILMMCMLVMAILLPTAISEENIEWEMQIDFSADDLLDYAFIGEAPDASDWIDVYDRPKPPTPPAEHLYAFMDAGLPAPYNCLARDIREYPDECKKWDLTILYVGDEATITISWDSIVAQSTEYDNVILVDSQNGMSIDMAIFDEYTFASQPTSHFEIVCGNTITITSLCVEWNMFSIPLQQPVSRANITVVYNNGEYTWQEAVDDGLIVGLVYGWDRINQQYYNAGDFEPGYAYWMFSYVECDLETH